MLTTKEGGQYGSHRPAFLMSVHIAIAPPRQSPHCGQEKQQVKWDLCQRWSNFDFANKRERWRSIYSQTWHLYLFPNGIGHQIDLIAQRGQRLNTMIDAKRRASRL